MYRIAHKERRSVLLFAFVQAVIVPCAMGQAVPFDPLALESAPVEKVEAAGPTKILIEGAIGNASQRYQSGSVGIRRTSFDLTYSDNIDSGLRAVFSNRIDVIHPRPPGLDFTVNSLREAYLSLQPGDANTVIDFGRINFRTGPGYGYNPTDFFRDGSLRVLTSADPFALRRNRMGTVMLRGQRLWSGGSLSMAYSPKLSSRPSSDGWSVDLGSTNNRNRGLIALGTKFSQSVNTQFLLYKEDGMSPTLGANMTALLSDAAVAHLELTRGREPDLLSRVQMLSTRLETRNRFVGGVTYTTLGKTSITAEYQYNGFGLDQAGFTALGVVPGGQLTYVIGGLRRQDLATRQAYLVYVTQKSLVLRDLDLTAYLRINPSDNSRLAWIELRHHWPNFDLTFQFQQHMGGSKSEFGILPDRRIMQVLGTYYF